MKVTRPVTPTATASAAPGATASASPSPSSPSLLPDPAAALASADPLAILCLLQSQQRALGVSVGTAQIRALQTQAQQALAKEQDAVRKAAEAMQHKSFWDSLGGIFGEVAKVAGVVASVAAAIATCGAATPIAALAIGGAVLSAASFADGELHVLQQLGVDTKTASWIDAGLGAGGMAVSFVSALAVGAAAVSGIVGEATGVATMAASAGSGVAHVESGQAAASADRAAADELSAQAHTEQLRRQVERVLAEIQTSDEHSARTLQAIAMTGSTQNDTAVLAATAVRG